MAIKPSLRRGRIGSESISDALHDLAQLDEFTVATAPAPADHENFVIVVTDGNAGAKCLAVSDGTSWLRVPLGAAVAAV